MTPPRTAPRRPGRSPRRRSRATGALLALGACLAAAPSSPAAVPGPRPAREPDPVRPVRTRIPLFNGRDLEGWHSWLVDTGRQDPRGVFSVRDGVLRISGDGLGYLATDRIAADYRLEVEWRWGTLNTAWGDRLGRARDSGVFLHAVGPDGNSEDGRGAFMAAIECNLFQGAVGDLLLIRGRAADGTLLAPRLRVASAPERDPEGWFTWRRGGPEVALHTWGRVNASTKSPDWRDVTDFRGPDDAENPPGTWNLVVCEARGDRLRVFVNGRQVNEARDLHPARGRILLQCEGSEIFFRRVDLAPLDPEPGPRPRHGP